MRVRTLIGIAVIIAIAGCQQEATPPAAATTAVTEDAGIAWFAGDLAAAFAASAAENKPVFLYWGAEWCPPCHDLNAHVFSRRDFKDKLKQFIPVYLDGDAPGAQRIAGEFEVLGYPTAVVLRADRKEIARIAGGMDLGRYVDVLDLALDNVRPLPEVLAGLRADSNSVLGAADCRRLAYNGWLVDPQATNDRPALVETLELAANRCPAASVDERDRLLIMAAGVSARAEGEQIAAGQSASAQQRRLVGEVVTLLADQPRSQRLADVLLDLGPDFFATAAKVQPASRASLQQNWFALMDVLETDPHFADSLRLLSAAGRLYVAKALDAQGKVPPAVEAKARATLDTFLARHYDADARSGIVNSASWVLDQLGDDVRLRSLLEAEIQTSGTPYYYMPDLASLDEKAGRHEQALAWLERAYRESRGPATRFQWGVLYVDGLLRMSPKDEPRIRAAVLSVIGELDGPDRIHARARARLARVNTALKAWASDSAHAAAVADIGTRWHEICSALPDSDPVRGECPGLLLTRT